MKNKTNSMAAKAVFFIFFIMVSFEGMAQFVVPKGEQEVNIGGYNIGNDYKATSHCLYFTETNYSSEVVYCSPIGDTIVSIVYCMDKFFVSQKNGTTILLSRSGHELMPESPVPGSGLFQFTGDALYAISNSGLYVSRDSAHSWQVDTAGVNFKGLNVNNTGQLALDTSQYVYLPTGDGFQNGNLYVENPDSNVWHKIGFFKGKSVKSVYADRKNRLYASVNQYNAFNIYYSADRGKTWAIDSTGIGADQILGWGDDVFGNVYAIGYTNNYLFRSDGGTKPWVHIEQNLLNQTGDIAPNNGPGLVNSIGGDSAIFVTTVYGSFISKDLGKTWVPDNNGIPAENITALLKQPSGKWFCSTDLGIFKKTNDSTWAKTYPVKTYSGSRPIYSDSAGDIFTIDNINNNGTYTYIFYKSTDNGGNWGPDTLGFGAIKYYSSFFADNSGALHIAYGNNIYSKTGTAAWALDVNGIKPISVNNGYSAFTEDKSGNLYVSIGNYSNKGGVWRRPLGGGGWVADTAGLNGKFISTLGTDVKGNVYGADYKGNFYTHRAGQWMERKAPTGLFVAGLPYFSFDGNGVLFAYFQTYNSEFFQVGAGIYESRDTGLTWVNDGIGSYIVNDLVSYNDTTYAATNDGVFLFTSAGIISGIEEAAKPVNVFAVNLYPDPAGATVNIGVSLPQTAFTTIKIYDITGKEACTLSSQYLTAGNHTFTWNTSNTTGLYIYHIQAGNDVKTGKFVIEK